jgi:hypothetical protein
LISGYVQMLRKTRRAIPAPRGAWKSQEQIAKVDSVVRTLLTRGVPEIGRPGVGPVLCASQMWRAKLRRHRADPRCGPTSRDLGRLEELELACSISSPTASMPCRREARSPSGRRSHSQGVHRSQRYGTGISKDLPLAFPTLGHHEAAAVAPGSVSASRTT